MREKKRKGTSARAAARHYSHVLTPFSKKVSSPRSLHSRSLILLFPSPLKKILFRLIRMAPLRTRKSSVSSKVTLYQQPTTPPPPHALPSTPLRRSTRSTTTTSTPLFDAASDSDTSIKDEDEEDVKPVVVRPKPTRKPTPRKLALDIPHPAPKNWEKQYAIIEEQRKTIVAPVDMMGCEQGGFDQNGEEKKPVKLSWKVKPFLSLLPHSM